MKTSKRNRLLGLALVSSCSLFSANNVLAAAGDDIANRATISFSVGGAAQTDIGSSPTGNTSGAGTDTVFKEDRVINFTVVRGGATSQAVPNAILQAVEYTLTNNGNGDQGFLLKGLNNADATVDPHGGSTDIFEPTSVQTFIENGTNPGFQFAEDTVAFVATLAPLANQVVYVVSSIPLTQSDGTTALLNNDVAVMTLVAQVAVSPSTGIAADAIANDDNGNVSPGGNGFTNATANVAAGTVNNIADDPATEQVVFNDAAGTQNGAGGTGAIKNAQHADDSSYTIQTATLTVTKTSTALWDPVNNASNPKSIPGAYVTYSVSIVNAVGAADAALTTLSDVLPATLALDPDFVTNDGATPTSAAGAGIRVVKGATTIFCTGAADADGCAYTGGVGGTITVDLSHATFAAIMPLAGNETVTVEFNAIVQ
ncbi:hypothetical protein JYT79_01075 [Cardiobacterium sp. AH-315-I02]|nr:hypothetical protein [Cardiobacterium sp. AH-315-I02]